MENSFQTSFIPKKPITTSVSSGNTTRPPTSIFTVLAFGILVIVGASSVGLYLYKSYLTKQEDTLSYSLKKVSDNFENDTISELELYDKRSSAAKVVLDKHVVLSPMFKLIGEVTIPSIQYTSFNMQTTSQGFAVKLNGIAADYKSIALQADAFNSAKGRSFRNVVFSDINKDKNNSVNFSVEFLVDPELLSYEKDLLLEQALQSKNQPQTAPAPADQTPAPDNTTTPTNNTNPSPVTNPTQ